MRMTLAPCTLIAAALLAAAPAAAGPAGPGRGPRGAGRYDPTTVDTVAGEIVAVRRVEGRRGGEGVHLDVRTPGGVLRVHLGPARHLERERFPVAEGQAIEVTGSRVVMRGKPVLLAREARSGEARVVLRDVSGEPAWGRGGR